MSTSLFLSRRWVRLRAPTDAVCLLVSLRLISLGMFISRSSHATTDGISAFIFAAEQHPRHVRATSSVSVHLSVRAWAASVSGPL